MPLNEQLKSDLTGLSADPLPEDALPLPGEDAPPGDGALPSAQEEPLRSAEERLSRYHDAVLEALSRGDAARDELLSRLDRVLEAQERGERRLAQALRENADFQIQVRRGMQQDLDALRKQQEGEQFTPLLREIASIYVEYRALLDCGELPERHRKNLRALFDQLEDLLAEYGAQICRTETGAERPARTCRIAAKLPTGDRDKHNTVAVSRKPGVLRGSTVLYPELADVFVYDPSLAEETAQTADSETDHTEGGNGK